MSTIVIIEKIAHDLRTVLGNGLTLCEKMM